MFSTRSLYRLSSRGGSLLNPSVPIAGFSSSSSRFLAADGALEGKPFRRKQLQKQYREIIQRRRSINEEHEQRAADMNLPFRTVCASVLHRYPVITLEYEDWEADFHELQEKIMDHQREHLMSEIMGTPADDLMAEQNPSYEEIMATMPFTPAPRITQADLENDRRSLERKLDRSCFLIVKRNREDKSWQFPQGKYIEEKDEGSTRRSAERVLDRAVGRVNRYFLSNSPIGHLIYEYPEAIQKKRGEYGAKVFFYRAQLIQGNIKLETRLYTDYAWIGRDEVEEYFDEETAAFMKALLPT